MRGWGSWLVLAGLALALAALPLGAGNYLLRLATTVCMYAVLAQSWNFIGGLAGYPSFATAAFFGFGAYTSAIMQNHGAPMVLSWGCAGLAAMTFAAFLGVAILHLRGHYFAIASLVVAEMLREIVNAMPDLAGGGKGLNLPILRLAPAAEARVFFYAMLGLALICTAAAIVIHQSKLGFGLRCIQQNEDAASMLGVNAYAYKTAAFSLSAVFVGVAGAIYASWVKYIEPPDVFDVLLAIKPMVMVLLGGLGTIFGPALGAVILLAFEELVSRNFLTIHAAALGLIIVVLILFLPNGILATLTSNWFLRARWPVDEMTALLTLDNVSRRFGGLNAVDGVSFSVEQGEIVGLIGPNGAGKTTLINLITGVHPATAGRVYFEGNDITRARAYQIARLGLARTFQIVQPFPRMTVVDNVAAGALFCGHAGSVREARTIAREHLAFTGLADLAERPAASLTLARRKRLELAKSLAMRPRLLMLDEVNAGLNPAEVDDALAIIRRIAAQGVTIVVIEHLMKVDGSRSQSRDRAAPWPVDRTGNAARDHQRS